MYDSEDEMVLAVESDSEDLIYRRYDPQVTREKWVIKARTRETIVLTFDDEDESFDFTYTERGTPELNFLGGFNDMTYESHENENDLRLYYSSGVALRVPSYS